jgi:hypothetical protein
MFRRDFLSAIAAAAAGLIVPTRAIAIPTRAGKPVLSNAAIQAEFGELMRLLKKCRCIEISSEAKIGDIMRHRTVHRSGDDLRGVSLNAEFEKWFVNAKPTSVSYSAEVEYIDMSDMSGTWGMEQAISLVEVEWVGGGI